MIRDELKERNMTQKQLAAETGIKPSVLSETINGKRSVSLSVAVALEKTFGIPADVWMNLQTQYNLDTANIDGRNVNRPELRALELADKIYEQKINVARAEFLPNVALTGGYTWTNPNCFDGFENKMKGMWTVGIGVKIPIITGGERIYKTRAAKLEAAKASYKLEETQEKIELQVKQSSQHVIEAAKRLSTAQKSLQSAQENLHYANVGLKEGVIPVSNVLLAETAWLQAQSAMVQAKIDLKLAQLYLNKATGQLRIGN
jgi:addiction module HigA family antidote